MVKASRPKPKRAPAAKNAAAQKKKRKNVKPRLNSPQGGSQACVKELAELPMAARKTAAIASLPGVVVRGRIGPRFRNSKAVGRCLAS